MSAAVRSSLMVSLNLLARRRVPKPAATIETPEGLRLRHPPVADCHRYDRLRETAMERHEVLEMMIAKESGARAATMRRISYFI